MTTTEYRSLAGVAALALAASLLTVAPLSGARAAESPKPTGGGVPYHADNYAVPMPTGAPSAKAKAYSPYAGRKYPTRVLWGDTHLHGANSGDSFTTGTRFTPEETYRISRGEEVLSTTGLPARLPRPLDFVVLSDHAEGLGLITEVYSSNPVLTDPKVAGPLMMSVWQRAAVTADKYNEPGKFTTLIGFEWTPTPGGDNLQCGIVLLDEPLHQRGFGPVPILAARIEKWRRMQSPHPGDREARHDCAPHSRHEMSNPGPAADLTVSRIANADVSSTNETDQTPGTAASNDVQQQPGAVVIRFIQFPVVPCTKRLQPMLKLPLTLAIAAAFSLPTAHAVPLTVVAPSSSLRTMSGPSAPQIDRAIKALDAGNVDAAEAAFRAAVKLDPKAPGGYIGLAEVAARRNQSAQVEGWLKKALEVDPNGVQTLRVLGRYQYQRGQYAEAEATFKKAVAAAPDDVDALLNLGEVQLRGLKNPKAAEATFRAAIGKSPGSVEARLALAAALAAQGRTDDAVAAFEQAARTAPKDPVPLLALARYQASRGQIEVALATLDRLIAAVPNSAQAYMDRGDLLLMKNDVPKAMDSYRAMIKADPASAANGHFRIAKLQEAQQQWAAAEQSYRTTIKLDPGHAAAYNNLAYMLASRGQQLDEALRLANRAVELAPKDPAMLDTLGWVYRARGDLQMAAKTIGRAIAARPQVAVFHYHLGIVQSELGRKAEAEASLKRALELDPKFRGADDARQRLQKLVAAGR